MIQEDLKKHGYAQEEEYFYKLNRELIEKNRKSLNQQRNSQKSQVDKESFWMRCPKCGHALKEIEIAGIKIDQCSGCSGVFLDSGELDLLLESREVTHFLDRVKRMWKKS